MNPNSEPEGVRRSSRKKKGDQETEARPFVTTRAEFVEDTDQEIAGTSGYGGQGRTVPPGPVAGGPVAGLPMARTFSRLKYRKFRGDGREDVDEWLSEFNATAAAVTVIPRTTQEGGTPVVPRGTGQRAKELGFAIRCLPEGLPGGRRRSPHIGKT